MTGRTRTSIAFLAAGWLLASLAPAQLCDPRPLRELNFTTTARSSSPAALGVFNGRAVFSAEAPDTGRELWATDGTAIGTVLIADTTAGTSTPTFAALAGTSRGVFIRVSPPSAAGSELWVTLGTPATTQRLITTTNIAGITGSIVAAADRGDGGIALLIARGQTTELWCSDGTPAGTQLLRTFDCCEANFGHDHFERIGARLFFAAGEAATGREIWSTDALPGGSTISQTQYFPEPQGSMPTWLRAVNSRLYFSGLSPVTGSAAEPFAWSSIIGAYSLGTLNPSSSTAGSVPTHFLPVGGGASGAPSRVVFFADDGTHGRELWVTSGASLDASLVVDLAPGIDSGGPPSIDQIGNTAVVGDRVIFVGFTPATGFELFVTDGTAVGTTLLREFVPGTSGGVPGLGITRVSDLVAFVESATSAEPVVTDGTVAGTFSISQLVPGPVSGVRRMAGVANGRLYIATDDALYRTDGTLAGTELLAQLPSGAVWSGVGQVQDLGSVVVVSAVEGASVSAAGSRGQEPWVIDVAAHTARMLLDLNPADSGTQPINAFAPLSGLAAGTAGITPALFVSRIAPTTAISSLWAVGTDPAQRVNLLDFGPTTPITIPSGVLRSFPFGAGSVVVIGTTSFGILYVRTDGTPAGTWPILTVPQQGSAAPLPAVPSMDARAGSVVVMSGFSQLSGQELWMTPGSPDSGGQLVDIYPGFGSSRPTALTSLGEVAFFFAFQPATGYEPWVSDGTAAGTFKLREIAPGAQSSVPAEAFPPQVSTAVLNGRVYFGATEGSIQRVWSSDGTTAGTAPLVLPAFTFVQTPPRRFVATSSLVFFEATLAATGAELYATDGTAAGTRFLGDVTPGGSSTGFREIVAGRNRVFFTPVFGPLGVELWTSDGTAAGTVITRDIVPGGGSSTPTNLTMVGDVCYFTLSTPSGIPQGIELWRSDGTAAGTCMVADINTIGSSNPQYLRAVGSRLYFNAFTPVHGTEPWVLSACAADFDNSGTLNVQDLFDYLNAWFAGSPAADFDATPGLSAQDIFDYLGAWFMGC